ncbi:hypothetical protein V6N13_071471 [Hibiscus sabdariffa]
MVKDVCRHRGMGGVQHWRSWQQLEALVSLVCKLAGASSQLCRIMVLQLGGRRSWQRGAAQGWPAAGVLGGCRDAASHIQFYN